MLRETKCAIPSKQLLILAFVILIPAAGVAQSVPAGSVSIHCPSTPSDAWNRLESSTTSTALSAAEEPYQPISVRQRLLWFAKSTAGPAHVVGVALVSAGGTAMNRPFEYGPHWGGFADRVGSGAAGSAVGNAIEGTAGVFLGEDPRYFGQPEQAFKSRVENTIGLTFLARTSHGSIAPAYARYLGIVGGNFLSNSWRPRSEANTHDALLRSSEGFAGRLAANAFAEFWPDVRKRIFPKRK
jgi:hypothetical protein